MYCKMNALCKALEPTFKLFMTIHIFLSVSLEDNFYVYYQRKIAPSGVKEPRKTLFKTIARGVPV